MATLSRNLRLDVTSTHAVVASSHPKTKIVCTIGPKTMSVDMLGQLLDAGMNVCRMNFSHGTHQYHGEVVKNCREASKIKNKTCGIMLDTKGPEIRTGKLKDHKEIDLAAGDIIKVCADPSFLGSKEMICLDYRNFLSCVKPGGFILIADGLISLSIQSVELDKGYCTCRVNNTAKLGETKNVHLPGAIVDLPAVSEKDILDIKFGMEQGVDFIAASFIRKAEDVITIRNILGAQAKSIHIISKIENQEGLDNFNEILAVSDGIMVARGDLGVEVEMEKIFIAQKMMVSKCNAANKPVITATQMLESMIKNPRPTRAELTDVANAVLDGTDCVMLSGETASGDYPIEAVRIMAKICAEAELVESQTDYHSLFTALKLATPNEISVAETVASYAVATAIDLNAKLIITFTETGLTTRLVCKYRPPVPVVSLTSERSTFQHLTVTRATIPMQEESLIGTDALVKKALGMAWEAGLVTKGSRVVVVAGIMEGVPGRTNSFRVLTLGESVQDIKL
eukprot:TRINITY_DN2558_c0_g1_i1.p1 TRINITY_DN2558_c0_g1~~TRINITY_DN2558_c0_g1_i1.p1  ORF type:complete len:511 (+),score=168.61 TRINITY_DN2558_c0_g1_i1:210-1742(+)